MDGSYDPRGGNSGGNQYGNRGGNQYGNRGGNQYGGYGGNQTGSRGGYGGGRGGSQDGARGGYGGRGGYQDGGRSEATFSTIYQVPPTNTLSFEECINPGIYAGGSEVLINSYGVRLPTRDVTRYELKFFTVRSQAEKVYDLSEVQKSEVMASVRRNCITRLYDLLFQQHSAYFEYNKKNPDNTPHHIYAYDRSSIFFCSLHMKARDDSDPFQLDISQLNAEVFGTLSMPRKVYATLKSPNRLHFDGTVDRLIMEDYLDILFCQYQHDMLNDFVKFGPKVYDLQSKHDLGGMIVLKDGHSKSVRYAKDDTTAKLIVDGKLSPFYTAVYMLPFIHGMFSYGPYDNWLLPEILQNLMHLKGIFVRTTHKSSNEVFKIHGFTQQSASKTQFQYKDQQIDVPSYFKMVYDFDMQFPHFPLVIKRVYGVETYYPMECLKIQQGQKIQREKMDKAQEATMIRQAQRAPLDLMENITNQKQRAHLFDADSYMQNAEVGINPDMDKVSATIVAAPMITYASSGKKINFAEWTASGNDAFVMPVTINAFVIFFYQVNEGQVHEFGNQLVTRANRLGMQLGVHGHGYHQLYDKDINIEALTQYVERYRDGNFCTYAMFFGDAPGFHDLIKATEVKTGVTTQQIMPKTLGKAGAATYTNIIQKINPKNGGFNHFFQQAQSCQSESGTTFDLFKTYMKGTMVIGIFMNHPPPGLSEDDLRKSPSVGGYAYNTGDEGNVARGGFFYTKCYVEGDNVRSDGSTPLVRKVDLDKEYRYPFKNALKHYLSANGKYPQRILVYRFGASDGEFDKIQANEAMSMISAMGEVIHNNVPSLTIIGVRRHHITRLFKKPEEINRNDKAPKQNVTPGTCTKGHNSKDVVMVPHRALQGSAKPTIFTMLYTDEPHPPSEDVYTNVTHALCYMHEIVSSAISVPAHLRNAEQMANRGRNIWKIKGHEFFAAMMKDTDLPAIFDDASETLNPPIETRYWA